MDYSSTVFAAGFIIASLGAIMVYLSLRSDPSEIQRRGFKFLDTTISKASESRKLIKFTVIIAIIVIGVLYITSRLNLIAWF